MLRQTASLLLILSVVASHAAGQVASGPPRQQMIINFGGGGWKDNQVEEPCILPNPKDPAKLIMFFSGATTQAEGGNGSLGKAWANVSDPFTWHEYDGNPIFQSNPEIGFESKSVRLDSVIYNQATDEYWIYYTGTRRSATQIDSIGLATCPTGKDGYSDVDASHIKRYAQNPILSPHAQGRTDENCVSQGAIFRENGQWYSFYSYRTSTQTLPGIRLATSRDGTHWTKQPGPDLLTAAPEAQYFEWHQVYKIGGKYVMLLEGYNGGRRWSPDVAVSARLTSGWKTLPPTLIDQTTWPGYSDATEFHVATPAVYQIGGKWYLFFQAAHSGFYIVQHWAMYCLEANDIVKRIIAAK